MPVLQTERLVIRPFSMDDLNEAYAVLEGHPDVWRFDPGRQRTLEERRDALQYRIWEYENKGIGALAITLRDTGKLIGYAGLQLYLFEQEDRATPEVELFYKLGRYFWGRGYALEACREMVRYAFRDLRLPRIVTWTHRDNARSVALLRKLDMRIEPAPGYPEDVIAVLENGLIGWEKE